MKTYKVVLTDYMYETIQPFFDVYDKYPEIQFVPLQLQSKSEIMKATEYADAVMVHFDQLDKDIIDNLKCCKIIARSAVGFDNIDLNAASEKKIPVTNVPDYCIEEVSNHAMLLILNSIKKFNLLEETVKNGVWDYSVIKPVKAIRYMTLGLLGCGRIARDLAKKAQVFGMKVIAYDPFISTELLTNLDIEPVSKNELLERSDVISVHTPLNKETEKSINKETFNKMKNSAIFINTSRGGVVDEIALVDALKEKSIAGAGLDVLTNENISLDNPLLKMKNVIITPHAAWYSEESFYTLLTSAAEEVVRALKGIPVKNQVNKF